MTTENIEDKKFVLNKEELINYHNRLLEHPNVKLLNKIIEAQRMLETAAQIRKLLEEEEPVNEDVEQKEENDGGNDGEIKDM
jgi:hypothetical protein